MSANKPLPCVSPQLRRIAAKHRARCDELFRACRDEFAALGHRPGVTYIKNYLLVHNADYREFNDRAEDIERKLLDAEAEIERRRKADAERGAAIAMANRRAHRLKVARGNNRYCGPAAIAAVTGLTTHDAARAIREINGKRAIYGLSYRDMDATLTKLRVKHDYRCGKKVRQTLQKWLSGCDYVDGVFIVCAAHHWIVLDIKRGDVVVCDTMNRDPVPFAAADRHHIPARGIIKCIIKLEV